jgi:hypothetical protein
MVAAKKKDNWIDGGIVSKTGVPTIRFIIYEFLPFGLMLPYLDEETDILLVFRKREDAIAFGKKHSILGFRIIGMGKESWEDFKKNEEYVCVDKDGKRVEDQS